MLVDLGFSHRLLQVLVGEHPRGLRSLNVPLELLAELAVVLSAGFATVKSSQFSSDPVHVH